MWLDVNGRNRHSFMTQADGSFIPGYTGHCPMLKFKFGKCYGDNTRDIMREIRTKGFYRKPLEYRTQDRYEIESVPQREMPFPDHYNDIRYRERKYINGYTGYIPGLNFRYGKSYARAADDSMADFAEQQRETRRRADNIRSYMRSRSAPKMATVHSRDEVQRMLRENEEKNKYKENMISAQFPPIAGYTGHIPRIKGSEASLSKRYHCAAKRGLQLIEKEKQERLKLQNADENIKAILRDNNKKSSYWNWG